MIDIISIVKFVVILLVDLVRNKINLFKKTKLCSLYICFNKNNDINERYFARKLFIVYVISSNIEIANHILNAMIKSGIENGIDDKPTPTPAKKAALHPIEIKKAPAGMTIIAFAQISSVRWMRSGNCTVFCVSSFKAFLALICVIGCQENYMNVSIMTRQHALLLGNTHSLTPFSFSRMISKGA